MAEKYDDVLVPFLSLMRRELHANTRKGDRPGWLKMSPEAALLEVYWHVAKLSAAVKNKQANAIMEYSADVANMAMMVLDVCVGLVFEPTRAPVDARREAFLTFFADIAWDTDAQEGTVSDSAVADLAKAFGFDSLSAAACRCGQTFIEEGLLVVVRPEAASGVPVAPVKHEHGCAIHYHANAKCTCGVQACDRCGGAGTIVSFGGGQQDPCPKCASGVPPTHDRLLTVALDALKRCREVMPMGNAWHVAADAILQIEQRALGVPPTGGAGVPERVGREGWKRLAESRQELAQVGADLDRIAAALDAPGTSPDCWRCDGTGKVADDPEGCCAACNPPDGVRAVDELAVAIAYQLTKRLVVDMPTARAAVDEALLNVNSARSQKDSYRAASGVKASSGCDCKSPSACVVFGRCQLPAGVPVDAEPRWHCPCGTTNIPAYKTHCDGCGSPRPTGVLGTHETKGPEHG